MDLVTITDHDSIGGCLEYLDRHPDASDFFISEEVSCRLPQGDVEVHLGVYGMDERLHRELQPLRRDVFEVTARLREAGVFFVLNHLLHFYRRQLPLDTYLELLDEVPGVEARNGAMLREHNAARRANRDRDGRRVRVRHGWRQRRPHAQARRADMDRGARRRRQHRLGLPREPARMSRPARRDARRHGQCVWRRLRRRRQVLREPARRRPARSRGASPRGLPGVLAGVASGPVPAAGDRRIRQAARSDGGPARPSRAVRRGSSDRAESISAVETQA